MVEYREANTMNMHLQIIRDEQRKQTAALQTIAEALKGIAAAAYPKTS